MNVCKYATIRVIHNYTECLPVEVVEILAQCVFIAQFGLTEN
jgi:hypothetical protein